MSIGDLVMEHIEINEIGSDAKVKLACNECGNTRIISEYGTYNERCTKCGGVDWDVLGNEQ
jgi:ribosomal protein S27E